MTLRVELTVRSRDVSATLTVGAGETVAVMGPNGAGKSTLLGVVAGLLRPDEGLVDLDDRVLTRHQDGSPRVDVPMHGRQVALLAQEPLLFPHLTARDNVAFGPRSRGVPRREAEDRAAHWLAEVGVADLAGRRPGALSGGQAQRVAVARALAVEPRVLLLDEPMAAFDIDVTPDLRRTLRRVLADQTAVLVTHDVLDALLLADRIVVMDAGRIVEEGPTADVLARPRSPFAGRLAGLNLLTGLAADGGVRRPDGSLVHGLVTGEQPAPGEPAYATFRPAAVSVYLEVADGSPKNSFRVRIDDLQPLGDLIRVRAGELSADITPQSVTGLDLAPGHEVIFSVKAAEVSVYGL
ncbi:MAG: sulfate/molybdate ABC transporter ATP-binding protein [Nocardioides sp.]